MQTTASLTSLFASFARQLAGDAIEDVFTNAIETKIDDLAIKIIDIRDLLINKENINRVSEKGLVDQQDILALRRILKSGKKESGEDSA